MQKQKRISTLIGIIIISVAVFILFGTAFAYQYFFVKPEAVQTAGWKTYKSSLFDYEIKLPPQYKFSPGFISNGSSVTDIDSAGYSNENYAFGFEIFARSQDFIVKGCLKDSNGRDLTQTKNINGNIFYIEKERRPELGLKDSIPGSMQNSYNIMHNNKCYIISYGISPLYNKTLSLEEQNLELDKMDQILSTFKFTQAETENNKTPVIESITSGSGLVGTEIEIKGKNLTGFEGDLNAWMENVNGEKGIMYSEIPYDPKGANNVMRFKIEDKLCKTDNSYSGLPCVSFLNVVPGVYKIYTMPWGVKSNVVNFEVTDATSWKTYKNDQYGFEMQYPTDWKVEGSVLRLYDEENRQISWISVSVYNNEDLRNKFNFNGDLSQWVEAEKKGIAVECYPGACNKIEDNIYIDGQKTALVYQTVAYMAPPHIIYEFIKDNLAYEVDIGFSPDGDTSVARNIVSTFKFTK